MVVLWGVRDYEHRRAVAALDARLYHGAEPLRVSAFPYYLNPFKWYGVAETEKFYELVIVDSLTPEVDPRAGSETRYKREETPVTEAAKKSRLGRVYLDWAQYPMLEVEAGGTASWATWDHPTASTRFASTTSVSNIST